MTDALKHSFCPCCGDPWEEGNHRPARITFVCWSCGETWTDDFASLPRWNARAARCSLPPRTRAIAGKIDARADRKPRVPRIARYLQNTSFSPKHPRLAQAALMRHWLITRGRFLNVFSPTPARGAVARCPDPKMQRLRAAPRLPPAPDPARRRARGSQRVPRRGRKRVRGPGRAATARAVAETPDPLPPKARRRRARPAQRQAPHLRWGRWGQRGHRNFSMGYVAPRHWSRVGPVGPEPLPGPVVGRISGRRCLTAQYRCADPPQHDHVHGLGPPAPWGSGRSSSRRIRTP